MRQDRWLRTRLLRLFPSLEQIFSLNRDGKVIYNSTLGMSEACLESKHNTQKFEDSGAKLLIVCLVLCQALDRGRHVWEYQLDIN